MQMDHAKSQHLYAWQPTWSRGFDVLTTILRRPSQLTSMYSRIVERNISYALIMEDDVDWDVHIIAVETIRPGDAITHPTAPSYDRPISGFFLPSTEL